MWGKVSARERAAAGRPAEGWRREEWPEDEYTWAGNIVAFAAARKSGSRRRCWRGFFAHFAKQPQHVAGQRVCAEQEEQHLGESAGERDDEYHAHRDADH